MCLIYMKINNSSKYNTELRLQVGLLQYNRDNFKINFNLIF